MRKKVSLLMYSISVWFFFGLSSCSDKCSSEYSYYTFEPVHHLQKQVLDSIGFITNHTLENPGKIYYKDGFLFINEVNKGVHVIDNRNTSNPKNVGFINIPGNYDIAIRNNVLYADCYVDLITLDISNPTNPYILKRVENIFPRGGGLDGYTFDQHKGIITTYNKVKKSEIRDCEDRSSLRRNFSTVFSSDKSFNNSAPGNSDGKAGSMARFALYDNYLYALNGTEMQLLNISDPSSPAIGNKVTIEWGIETIFPYKDKLFIGSQNGMFIYDNKNPQLPQKISQINHVRSCDPVVVDDKYAYVTLRNGNECGGFTNQLDVIDIQDLSKPNLLKTYKMGNPHGLGKDKNTLFICDGSFGLKVFDASDILKITENSIAHYKNINSFDVIPLEGTLMMIGKDGLYQYDYSDLKNIKLLSVIPVTKPQ